MHRIDGSEIVVPSPGVYGTLAEVEAEFVDFVRTYILMLNQQFPQLIASGE